MWIYTKEKNVGIIVNVIMFIDIITNFQICIMLAERDNYFDNMDSQKKLYKIWVNQIFVFLSVNEKLYCINYILKHNILKY